LLTAALGATAQSPSSPGAPLPPSTSPWTPAPPRVARPADPPGDRAARERAERLQDELARVRADRARLQASVRDPASREADLARTEQQRLDSRERALLTELQQLQRR
jgi:hypothetical protein